MRYAYARTSNTGTNGHTHSYSHTRSYNRGHCNTGPGDCYGNGNSFYPVTVFHANTHS